MIANLKIAVTGATGLVGYHAVKRFVEKGHSVVAVVRHSSNTRELEALAAGGALTIARAAITDGKGLQNAFAGVNAVIHAAGMVDPHATREQTYETNVQGTEAALLAAEAAGAEQFIHISSLSVITGRHDQFGVNEQAPLVYCGEAYADSKVDAEKAVMKFFGRGRMSVTILRPGFIYGPGERAWMPRLIGNLRAGKAMLIDGGVKQTNVIYVENLVTAIELALMNMRAANQVFNLTDGQVVTKKELFDTICDELAIPRVKRQVPGWLARAACEVVSSFAPMLPPEKRAGLSRFSRAAFRLAGLNQGFDVSKAEAELKYTTRIPFNQGMRETLSQFKNSEQKSSTPAANQVQGAAGGRT